MTFYQSVSMGLLMALVYSAFVERTFLAAQLARAERALGPVWFAAGGSAAMVTMVLVSLAMALLDSPTAITVWWLVNPLAALMVYAGTINATHSPLGFTLLYIGLLLMGLQAPSWRVWQIILGYYLVLGVLGDLSQRTLRPTFARIAYYLVLASAILLSLKLLAQPWLWVSAMLIIAGVYLSVNAVQGRG